MGSGPTSERATRNIFFALRPNGSVLDAIAAAADAIAASHRSIGRRLKRHRLHMTVLHLDTLTTIPDTYLRHAIDAGDRIAVGPFELSLDIAGSFRTRDLPWWIGCSQTPHALGDLHRQLHADTRSCVEKSRDDAPFTPHVTIARSNREVLANTPIAPIRWNVEEVCLIDSVMGKPHFDVLRTWQLSGRVNG